MYKHFMPHVVRATGKRHPAMSQLGADPVTAPPRVGVQTAAKKIVDIFQCKVFALRFWID